MNTSELIETIALDLKPVRRLLPPIWRLAGWLVLSVPITAFIVAMTGVRPDIGAKMADPTFLTQELASIAVALTAAWAALAAGIPGQPRWKRWAPLVPLLLWISTLGRQCWSEWVHLGAGGMAFRADWMCLPGIAMIGAAPALAMVLAIRRGARLHGFHEIGWGSLAAAALANVALRLFHMEDAALMVIVWQFGSVLLLTAILTAFRNALMPARAARRRHGFPNRPMR